MNGNGRIFKKIQGKKNIYEEYQIKGGKQTETVRTVEITKNGSTGDITEKYSDGTVRIFYKNGNVYEGNFVDGKRRTRKGKYTVAEKETKKPLYTEVYDEKGIMTAVEYVFVEGNKNRIVVNYDEINKALNIGKIRDFEDLITKGYIWLCDKDGNKIKNPEWFDFNKVIECAKYQMQTRLKGSSNDLDDEKIIEWGYTGLQNIIILTNINDIEPLRRVRFAIKQNNPDWPKKVYENPELLLNSYGLTTENPTKNAELTSINNLKNIDYLSTKYYNYN